VFKCTSGVSLLDNGRDTAIIQYQQYLLLTTIDCKLWRVGAVYSNVVLRSAFGTEHTYHTFDGVCGTPNITVGGVCFTPCIAEPGTFQLGQTVTNFPSTCGADHGRKVTGQCINYNQNSNITLLYCPNGTQGLRSSGVWELLLIVLIFTQQSLCKLY